MKDLTEIRLSDLFKRSKEKRRILGWFKTRNKAEFKDVKISIGLVLFSMFDNSVVVIYIIGITMILKSQLLFIVQK